MIPFVLSADPKRSSITAIDPDTGTNMVVDSTHPRYQQVKDALVAQPQEITWAKLTEMANAQVYIQQSLSALSTHITYDGKDILWDGDVMHTALSRHLVSMLRSDDQQYISVVKFMERLANNPSPTSRIHLWSWLDSHDFTLTPDGMILGYKGVQNDGLNSSVSSGVEDVMVNGKVHRGHIPNPVGALVSMSRALVADDRNVACSVGLHVGTYSYASTFGVLLLRVLVDPADVVSVPRDCDATKMRVRQYQVLDASPLRVRETTFSVWDDDTDGDEDDGDYDGDTDDADDDYDEDPDGDEDDADDTDPASSWETPTQPEGAYKGTEGVYTSKHLRESLSVQNYSAGH